MDSSMYFLCNMEDFKFLATVIQNIPLELKDRYIYCCSPLDNKVSYICAMFVKVSGFLRINIFIIVVYKFFF